MLTREQFPEDGQVRLKHAAQFNLNLMFTFNVILSYSLTVTASVV
jgi:hypothetical protein